tara:strand:- start:174 stop:584 length:411 start_codon:yes stop_codon:yes gene_type:complete
MPAPKKKVKPVEPVLVLEPECACYSPETCTGDCPAVEEIVPVKPARKKPPPKKKKVVKPEPEPEPEPELLSDTDEDEESGGANFVYEPEPEPEKPAKPRVLRPCERVKSPRELEERRQRRLLRDAARAEYLKENPR